MFTGGKENRSLWLGAAVVNVIGVRLMADVYSFLSLLLFLLFADYGLCYLIDLLGLLYM